MRKFSVADAIQLRFRNSHPEKVRKRHQLSSIHKLMDPINDPYCRNYIDTQTTKPYFKQQIYFMTCSLKWSRIQTTNVMSFGIPNSKLIDEGGII